MTPELARSINGAETKVELEDLYAPYRPKRRTKAQIAREAGLEPLADALLAESGARCPTPKRRKIHRCGKGRRRRQGRARRRPPYPDRAHGRGAGPGRHAARMGVGRRRARVQGHEEQDRGGRQVLRLFRFRPKGQGHSLASRARHAARPQRRRARPRPRRAARGRQAASGRSQDHGGVRHRRSRPAGRQVAGRDRQAGVEGADGQRAGCRPARPAQGTRRRRGHLRVLQEPEGPAARRTGRPARHHGPRSGLSQRRQGCRGGPDRQGRRHRHDLPARAAKRLGRLARDAGRAVHEAQGRSHQHRQRHRQPRDRQDGRRADRPRCPTSR